MFYNIMSDDVVDDDPDWAEQAQQLWVCGRCHHPKVGCMEADVRVLGPHRFHVSFLASVGIPIVSRKFFEKIGGDSLKKYIISGKVFDQSGTFLSDYVTVRPKYGLYLRGYEGSTNHGPCQACGRIGYIARNARDRRYVLSSTLVKGCPIYQSDGWALVVNNAIYTKIGKHRWGKVFFEPIYVQKKPFDNLTLPTGVDVRY